MTAPPTWRDLGRRARRQGLGLYHDKHQAQILSRIAPHILRSAVAAALDHLEAT